MYTILWNGDFAEEMRQMIRRLSEEIGVALATVRNITFSMKEPGVNDTRRMRELVERLGYMQRKLQRLADECERLERSVIRITEMFEEAERENLTRMQSLATGGEDGVTTHYRIYRIGSILRPISWSIDPVLLRTIKGATFDINNILVPLPGWLAEVKIDNGAEWLTK